MFSVRCHNGFRMKLYAIDEIFFMLYRHYFSTSGKRCDFQAFRHGVSIRRKRMITGNGRSFGTACKQRTIRIKFHIRLLAVHQFFCIGNSCAKCRTDRLMTETDSQNGNILAEHLSGVYNNSCILRSAGAGREDNAVGVQGFDFLYRHFIIADDLDIRLDFPDELEKVIGKTVVVINQ